MAIIAPQELRLGNWVTIDNPKAWMKLKDIPLQIIGISKNMDRLDKELFPNSEAEIILQGNVPYSQFSEFISPIELTEEWLLRMGFEKVKSYYEEAETFDFYYGNIYFDMANQSTKINGYYCLSFVPEYVHQLQNLFYCLTGEELQLKN